MPFGTLRIAKPLATIELKRLNKKVDNKRHLRWFRRFLKFEVNMYVLVFSVMFLGAILFGFVNQYYLKVERTKKELNDIENALVKYFQAHAKYPASMNDLIRNRPINNGWHKDYWENNYEYVSTSLNYTVQSAGIDGEFNTNDDLKISNY